MKEQFVDFFPKVASRRRIAKIVDPYLVAERNKESAPPDKEDEVKETCSCVEPTVVLQD